MDIESYTDALQDAAKRRILAQFRYMHITQKLTSIDLAADDRNRVKEWLEQQNIRIVTSTLFMQVGWPPLFDEFDDRKLIYKNLWAEGMSTTPIVKEDGSGEKMQKYFDSKGFAAQYVPATTLATRNPPCCDWISIFGHLIVSTVSLGDWCVLPLEKRRKEVSRALSSLLPSCVVRFCVLPYVGRV